MTRVCGLLEDFGSCLCFGGKKTDISLCFYTGIKLILSLKVCKANEYRKTFNMYNVYINVHDYTDKEDFVPDSEDDCYEAPSLTTSGSTSYICPVCN